MRIDVHCYLHFGGDDFAESIRKLNLKVDHIMSTQAELEAALIAVAAQLDKAAQEIMAEVRNLESEIASAGQTSAGVDAALQSLKDKVQQLDDLNPDAPPVETPPVETPPVETPPVETPPTDEAPPSDAPTDEPLP